MPLTSRAGKRLYYAILTTILKSFCIILAPMSVLKLNECTEVDRAACFKVINLMS